jgi:hypothetical protein
MPSGREYHTPKLFVTPALEEDVIVRMRGPPDPGDAAFEGEEDDSGEEEERESANVPVGAFPGTKAEYSAGTTYY